MLRNLPLYIIVALLLSASEILASESRDMFIKAGEHGVVLQLRNLKARLQSQLDRHEKFGTPLSAVVGSHSFKPSLTQSATELQFFCIVPDNGELQSRFHATKMQSFAASKHQAAFAKPGISVRRIGKSRGETVAVITLQCLDYTPVALEQQTVDEAVIELSWDSKLTPHSRMENERTLVPVVNEGFTSRSPSTQSLALTRSSTTKNSSAISDAASMPLTVIATRDGVARILMSRALEVHPDWKSRSTSSLHLELNGIEQRLYIPGDDGFIDANDTLYYWAQHATADTTWMSSFTWDHVYYLSCDSSKSALRYAQAQSTVSTPVVDQIEINLHLEQEWDYNQSYIVEGQDFVGYYASENVAGEKWFWASFNRDNPFDYPTPLVVSARDGDSLEVSVLFNSINDMPAVKPDKRVQFLVNNILQYDETFDGAVERRVRARIASADLVGGVCGLRCFSIGEHSDALNYSESQIVDYFDIKGKVDAVMLNSSLEGSVQSTGDALLRVRDCNSARLIVLDTLNRRAMQGNGKSGTGIYASARRSARMWSSVNINSTNLIQSRQEGLNVLALTAPEYKLSRSWSGGAQDTDLLLFLDSLNDGSIVVLTTNDSRAMSSSLVSWLTRNGSLVAPSIRAKDCFVCALQKGTKRLYAESRDTLLASISSYTLETLGRSFECMVPLFAGNNNLMMTAFDSIETSVIQATPFSNLKSPDHDVNYLIITHRDFETSARRLATYRSSPSMKSEVVFIDDIYREFNHGQKTTQSIRDFLSYAYNNWTSHGPRYVLLFGDASWDGRQIPPKGKMKDFVPSFGKPVSDVWYTLVDGTDSLPDFCIGRLPVQTPLQAEAMINKIIAYDTLPADLWWKRFLFTSGGDAAFEKEQFRDMASYNMIPFVTSDVPDFRSHSLCGDTAIVTNLYLETNPTYSPTAAIQHQVNGTGVCWVNYIGHGAPSVTQFGDWVPSTMTNRAKPFVLSTLACQNAAFAERELDCLDETFLDSRNGGAIAAIGATGYAIPLVQMNVNVQSFVEMAQNAQRRLGDIFTRSDAVTAVSNDDVSHVVFLQCCLLGDPLTRMPFDTVPHPVVLDNSTSMRDVNGASFITDDRDSAYFNCVVFNAGVHSEDSVRVLVVHEFQASRDSSYQTLYDFCYTNPLQCGVAVLGREGDHRLKIVFDPEHKLGFTSIDTVFDYPFHIYSPRPVPVDPFPYWNVSASHPRFRAIIPSDTGSGITCEAQLRMDSVVVDSASVFGLNGLMRDECFIEWTPSIRLQSDQRYVFAIRSQDTISKRVSAWLEIPFYACPDNVASSIVLRADVAHDPALFHSDNFRLDSAVQPIHYVLNHFIPYDMRSAVGYGYYDSILQLHWVINPGFGIRINGISYGDRGDQRGFMLRVMDRRADTVKFVRSFDCWQEKDTCATCFNGSGRTLIRFLRDSVEENDYVFLSVSGFNYGDVFVKRDQDSVQALLRQLGAKHADSLKAPHSYVFIGMKKRDGFEPVEVLRFDTTTAYAFQDTVRASGELRISPPFGSMQTRTFGPVKRWKTFTVSDRNSPPQSYCSKIHWLLSTYTRSAPRSFRTCHVRLTSSDVDLLSIRAFQALNWR